MMRVVVRSCAAAASLLAAGCISAPLSEAGDPIGCWYFERDAAAVAQNLPWGIRLADEALTGFPSLDQRGEAHLARTLDPDREREHPFGYWMAIAGDSLQIGYPAGGGMILRVVRGDMSMNGVARPLGDVIAPGAPPRTDTPVRLTRAQCPAY